MQKIGDAQHNYLRDGFYAKTQADEIKSTDLELNVLMSIEDVTARVNGAVKAGMTSEQAANARQAAIAAIEKESKDKTGLRTDVVTLYQGGAYHLYATNAMMTCGWSSRLSTRSLPRRRPGQFRISRYDLDICIRVYENGQPAKIDNF